MRALLFAILLPCAAWADGMVGVPDVPASGPSAPSSSSEGARREIVIHGNADTSIFERRLANYYANLARERAEADAYRRQRELEMTAVLGYIRGTADQAAREARDAADAASRRRQQEAELEAALGFGLSCPFYDPAIGCRGEAPVVRP